MKEFKNEYLDIVLHHMFIQGASVINDLKKTEMDPKVFTKIALSVAVTLKPACEYLKAFSDEKTKEAVFALEQYLKDGIYLDAVKMSKADSLFIYRIGGSAGSFVTN